MEKHKLNIFPLAQKDDYQDIREDIKAHGFDKSRPITLYEGKVLDGWNRQTACDELGATAEYTNFYGDAFEALAFVMQTNKRRSLNPGQKACLAFVGAQIYDEIAAATEAERVRTMAESKTGMKYNQDNENFIPQKIAPSNKKRENETNQKLAVMFNTNRTYIAKMKNLRRDDPEMFELVASGKKRYPRYLENLTMLE